MGGVRQRRGMACFTTLLGAVAMFIYPQFGKILELERKRKLPDRTNHIHTLFLFFSFYISCVRNYIGVVYECRDILYGF